MCVCAGALETIFSVPVVCNLAHNHATALYQSSTVRYQTNTCTVIYVRYDTSGSTYPSYINTSIVL